MFVIFLKKKLNTSSILWYGSTLDIKGEASLGHPCQVYTNNVIGFTIFKIAVCFSCLDKLLFSRLAGQKWYWRFHAIIVTTTSNSCVCHILKALPFMLLHGYTDFVLGNERRWSKYMYNSYITSSTYYYFLRERICRFSNFQANSLFRALSS